MAFVITCSMMILQVVLLKMCDHDHLQSNALAPAVLHKLAALQEGRQFHLIDRWPHPRCLQQLLQVANAEVGDPNARQLALN